MAHPRLGEGALFSRILQNLSASGGNIAGSFTHKTDLDGVAAKYVPTPPAPEPTKAPAQTLGICYTGRVARGGLCLPTKEALDAAIEAQVKHDEYGWAQATADAITLTNGTQVPGPERRGPLGTVAEISVTRNVSG
jgi:hypothetical protein